MCCIVGIIPSRHYLAFPTTRSNSALLPPEIDPVVYKPKPRNALVTTFCRKIKALLLRRVGPTLMIH